MSNMTQQQKLTNELISYVKLRLAMSLFPIRRYLLFMDQAILAELVHQQATNVGLGIEDLVEKYFPSEINK